MLPTPTVVRKNSRGDWYIAFYPLHKRFGGSWSIVIADSEPSSDSQITERI